jgi:hypothetical protein
LYVPSCAQRRRTAVPFCPSIARCLPRCRVAPAPAQQQPAPDDAPPQLSEPTLAAVKQALEALFEEQAVVTMADVRTWLRAFQAAPKAQHAAALSDGALTTLMLGGNSILLIRRASEFLSACPSPGRLSQSADCCY